MMVMAALWRVVSKVGEDTSSVNYLQDFEGLMYLGLPVTNAGYRKKRLENDCHRRPTDDVVRI
jgi:hypothetical protein